MITIVMSIAYLYPNYIEQRLIKLQAITKANRVGILARRTIGGYPKMGGPSVIYPVLKPLSRPFTPAAANVQTEATKWLINS